jgi:uncharacterized protein (DUF1501 family)
MPHISRRKFLVGCSTAIAAMAGARLTNIAFAAGGDVQETLIVVFLRGGWDALNVVPVIAGPDREHYWGSRPTLRVLTSGDLNPNSQPLARPIGVLGGNQFGLHPSLASLHTLFQNGNLAVIHAAGLNHGTRSHFDAMQYMELGTPGQKTISTGWVTRYLQTVSFPPTVLLPSLSAGSSRPTSVLGYPDNVALSSASSINLAGSSTYRDQQTRSLRAMYGNPAHWLDQAGLETLDTVALFTQQNFGAYTPANGAVYPNTGLGNNFRLIAQMIKANLGLRTATVDFGGWDTHENQGDATATSYMSTRLAELSNSLTAFFTDLDVGCPTYNSRTTVVVMSEFGRRLRENANRGTDHGHGNVMLVLGRQVRGGLYGNWPGLRNDQLFDRADLRITTDYRAVLSEILQRRMGRTPADLATIFPGYAGYTPLGFMNDNTPSAPLPPAGPFSIFLPLVGRNSNAAACP